MTTTRALCGVPSAVLQVRGVERHAARLVCDGYLPRAGEEVDEGDAAPTPAARRQRRFRERRRRGICMVPVELSEDHINVLTATGWLAPEDAADTHACGGAVRRILDALTKFPSRLKSAKRTKPV